MKSVRLLHIISSLKMGGAEAVLVDLLKALPSDHYEHHVIYFHDGPNHEHIQVLGIPTYHVHGFAHRYDPLFWWRVSRLIKTINPDLIHSSLWMASLVARIITMRSKISVICAVHAELGHHGALRNWLDYYTFSRASAIVAVSEGVAASLAAHLSPASAKKIVLIKNGIDVAAIQDKQRQQHVDRALLGLSPDHFVIGAVGRFVPVKLYDQLIIAFAQLTQQHDHVRLLLVGAGPLEGALRAQVNQLGLGNHVIFVISQPAYGYYPLMDCFVLPSLQEGLSIALLEAMASARACIVTSPDGMHPVVEQGVNGLIVVPKDSAQLVNALSQIIHSETLKIQLGNNAIGSIVRGFDLKSVADAYSRVIDAALRE